MLGRRRGIFGYFFKSQIFLTLVILGLLSFLGGPLLHNYQRQRQVNQEIASLKTEIAKAESQNQEFKKMVDYLQSPEFVEKEARLNLGLKKPGEEVVVVQIEPSDAGAAEQNSGEATPLINREAREFLNNLDRWVDYFFGAEGEI